MPHANVPGIRDDVQPGDDSLVGELEKAMDRNVTSGTQGDGVWPLDGKLKYISDNNLGSFLDIQHRGGGGIGNAADDELDGEQDYTAYGVTSHGTTDGNILTFEFIQSQLAAGEDVELCFVYFDEEGNPDGSHYVEVTGAGTILGVPFIIHRSDQLQSDVDLTDTQGTDGFQFDFWIDGLLTNENAVALQAISESVIPEPASATLAIAGMTMLLRRRRR